MSVSDVMDHCIIEWKVNPPSPDAGGRCGESCRISWWREELENQEGIVGVLVGGGSSWSISWRRE